jgi:hypothetical protein
MSTWGTSWGVSWGVSWYRAPSDITFDSAREARVPANLRLLQVPTSIRMIQVPGDDLEAQA